MISLIPSKLQISSDCRLASCNFDKSLFDERTAPQSGIEIPARLQGAVIKRKAEFIAGRYCAREALLQLDNTLTAPANAATIGIGSDREPLWPPGFVGSITHTHCFASAVVARRSRVRAIGIDSELWIEPGSVDYLSEQILTESERFATYSHLFETPLHYLTLVFSAKESLFKCLFPLVNRFFGFQAAVIIPLSTGSTSMGEFRFELQEALNAEFHAGYCGQGVYSYDNTMVHTAVMLPAAQTA